METKFIAPWFQAHIDRLRAGQQTTVGLYDYMVPVNNPGDMLTFAPPDAEPVVGTVGLFSIFYQHDDVAHEVCYYCHVLEVAEGAYKIGDTQDNVFGWSTDFVGKLIAVNGVPYPQQ